MNDNLLFSCCCARVDWTWTTVCGCYKGGWQCEQSCLEDALAEESLFYPVGTVSVFLVSYVQTRGVLSLLCLVRGGIAPHVVWCLMLMSMLFHNRICTITSHTCIRTPISGLLGILSAAHWPPCWVSHSAPRRWHSSPPETDLLRLDFIYPHRYVLFSLF